MNDIIETFLAPSSEDYSELSLENSCRRYYLPISHEKFCDYIVIFADSAFHSNHVQLLFKGKGNKYIGLVSYDYYEDLNYKESHKFEHKFYNSDIEIENITISEFWGDKSNKFFVKFKNHSKSYYFTPIYPYYLNWVYLIACSLKKKTTLTMTYEKHSCKILNIKLPDTT